MALFIAVACFIPITLSWVATTTIESQGLPKCCNTDEVFEKVEGTYKCSEDNTRRLQVNTQESGFWHDNITGECVEVLQKDFYVFNVSDKVVQTERKSAEEIFPKCCPLNYLYNPIIHSCEEQQYLNLSYIGHRLLQIGLPNCRVILDHKLKDWQNSLPSINSYCIDQTIEEVLTLRECKDTLNVCEEIRCFKKCCPDGQSFINGDICYNTYRYGLNVSRWANAIENPEAPHALIYKSRCDDDIFLMNENKYTFTIDSKGVFSYQSNFTILQIDEIGKVDSYCMEHVFYESLDMNGYYLFKCFDAEDPDLKFYYTRYAFIASSIALVLTIATYILLNKISKVFGKILVLYCINMLLLSNTLTYISFIDTIDDGDCEIVAFTLIFFGAASFTWANVLCWEIWCKLILMYRTGKAHRSRNRTKMFVYISYGWGIPLIITSIIILFHKFDGVLPSVIQPYIGYNRCFFEKMEGNYAKTLFFLIPLLLMETFNIFLFVKIALYSWTARKEISNTNDCLLKTDKVRNYKRNQRRLFVIFKLSIIMGISFIFEVGSAFVNMDTMGPIPKYIEIVFDVINALQGVYIFLIFICKKKVLLAVWSKFMKVKSPQGSSSSQSSQSNNEVSLLGLDAIVTKNGE